MGKNWSAIDYMFVATCVAAFLGALAPFYSF